MRIDHELRQLLVEELCRIIDGYDQYLAASFLGLHQPQISALRRGRCEGFSIGRLLRLIAKRHYNIEIHFRRIERPNAYPRQHPTVSIVRYDRFGHVTQSSD
jgi:predicted XRE-type DNA-binding protein